jgi:hypothetical protein
VPGCYPSRAGYEAGDGGEGIAWSTDGVSIIMNDIMRTMINDSSAYDICTRGRRLVHGWGGTLKAWTLASSRRPPVCFVWRITN